MLEILICEDEKQQRENLESIINSVILIENLDMKIAVSTYDPNDVLSYVKSNKKMIGLYFLDIDLNDDINGLELAAMIRALDFDGKIVFITTHSELSYMTFKYKIEALDYIIKDNGNVERKVKECILLANERYLIDNKEIKDKICIKVGKKRRFFDIDNIMFFEASSTPHKIIMHLDNSQVEFYGTMKEVISLDKSLVKAHKSIVVNKNNIATVDIAKREVTMVNQETFYASLRQLKIISFK